MVLDVDQQKRRISLGIKQTEENPWTDFAANTPVGTELDGEIKNITEFGLFVGLAGEIDGMVHLSDLSWTKSGEDAIKEYNKGDIVKAKVMDVDIEKERISLGIKQLTDDPVESASEGLKKGDAVTCTVAKVLETGVEVTVAGSVSGFIRRNDLSRERSEQRPDRFAEGDRLDAVITNIDRRDHKLTLSIKAHEIKEEKTAMAEYGSSDSGASLGDILGAAMRKAEGENAGAADDEPAAAEKPEAPEAVEAKAVEETAAEDEAGDVEDNEDNKDKDKE